ncbi:MAG: hypothetical protein S4CHLAM37_14900 [Chlamydiia bacterium]|nr:hypothetical protein [Chlamydiia bacterium]
MTALDSIKEPQGNTPFSENLVYDNSHHEIEERQPVSRATRIYYTALMVLLSPFVAFARTSLMVHNYLKKEDTVYAKAQSLLKTYVVSDLSKVKNSDLVELSEKIAGIVDPSIKDLTLDILSLDCNLADLKEILKGANIDIRGDKGFLFNKWKNYGISKKRHSSHKSDKDGCYSLRDTFFKQFLFWKDSEKHNTRFQIENNAFEASVRNLCSSILHAQDYLNYRKSGLQQGQFGVSPFTETNPIKITFNMDKYLEKRSCLEKHL